MQLQPVTQSNIDDKADWMLSWIRNRLFKRQIPDDITQARQLIHAVDRGGIPLNPIKINSIARNLGLEVSRRDPVERTVQRIRAYLLRIQS